LIFSGVDGFDVDFGGVDHFEISGSAGRNPICDKVKLSQFLPLQLVSSFPLHLSKMYHFHHRQQKKNKKQQ